MNTCLVCDGRFDPLPRSGNVRCYACAILDRLKTMLNANLQMPLTPGVYEIRTPSRNVRLIETFQDSSFIDPQTGQKGTKERWRGELFFPDGRTEGLKVYEMDGSYVAMNGVQSGLDLIRRIGD